MVVGISFDGGYLVARASVLDATRFYVPNQHFLLVASYELCALTICLGFLVLPADGLEVTQLALVALECNLPL